MRSRCNFLSLLACLLCAVPACCQLSASLSVYPFTAGTRQDSLRVLENKVARLLESQAVFEKTYLRGRLVFLPCDVTVASAEKPYWLYKEALTLYRGQRRALRRSYKAAKRRLTIQVAQQNERAKLAYASAQANRSVGVQVQAGLLNLSDTRDYVFVFCPRALFTAIDTADVRGNSVADSVKLLAEQTLLGKPHNIEGFVNSINYYAADLRHLVLPELVDSLLRENLRLNKLIITDSVWASRVQEVVISSAYLPGDNKLWLYTNVPRRTIYLSPYLLRAVFNYSFYQLKLLKLASGESVGRGNLRAFLGEKQASSVLQIDSAYFTSFVDIFSRNIFLVIGHELAHIYLLNEPLSTDIETACDSCAARFYLNQFHRLDLGLFETFLIQSIASDELDFWGHAVDAAALRRRYEKLKSMSF